MVSQRDRILGISDVRTEVVTIPEWGGEAVTVRSLNSAEMERWWDIVRDSREKNVDPPGGLKASMVFMGAIDGDHNPLFKTEDIPKIGEKHPTAIQRLFDAIQRASGITEEAEAEAEKKPEATKSSSCSGSVTDSE